MVRNVIESDKLWRQGGSRGSVREASGLRWHFSKELKKKKREGDHVPLWKEPSKHRRTGAGLSIPRCLVCRNNSKISIAGAEWGEASGQE